MCANLKVISPIRVSPVYVPFILSFIEDKNKNIPNIKGVGIVSLLKDIEKGIQNNILSADKFNFTMMESLLKEKLLDDVRTNFLCVDVESQYRMYSEASILLIKEQIVDLFDEQAIKKINEIYFRDNPMMIMEIQPYKSKRRINIFGV